MSRFAYLASLVHFAIAASATTAHFNSTRLALEALPTGTDDAPTMADLKHAHLPKNETESARQDDTVETTVDNRGRQTKALQAMDHNATNAATQHPGELTETEFADMQEQYADRYQPADGIPRVNHEKDDTIKTQHDNIQEQHKKVYMTKGEGPRRSENFAEEEFTDMQEHYADRYEMEDSNKAQHDGIQEQHKGHYMTKDKVPHESEDLAEKEFTDMQEQYTDRHTTTTGFSYQQLRGDAEAGPELARQTGQCEEVGPDHQQQSTCSWLETAHPLEPSHWSLQPGGNEREAQYMRFLRFTEQTNLYQAWKQTWFPHQKPDAMKGFSLYLRQEPRLSPAECGKLGAKSGHPPTASGLASRVRAEVN